MAVRVELFALTVLCRDQCSAGKYYSYGAGCVACPANTFAMSSGALKCLPACPVVSQLTFVYV